MSEGVVYFAQCRGTARIKIGFTTNVKKRMDGLNSGSSTQIKLLYTEPGSTETEAEYHQRFRVSRVQEVSSREWFYPTRGIRAFLRSNGITPKRGFSPQRVRGLAGEKARLHNELRKVRREQKHLKFLVEKQNESHCSMVRLLNLVFELRSDDDIRARKSWRVGSGLMADDIREACDFLVLILGPLRKNRQEAMRPEMEKAMRALSELLYTTEEPNP
jgi:hypothetical protein